MAESPSFMERCRRLAAQWWHVESLPVAVLLLVALATLAFVGMGVAVTAAGVQEFDQAVMRALRHPEDASLPRGPWWLVEIMRDLTALGSLGVLSVITVAAGGYLWLLGKRAAVAYLVAAMLGAGALNLALKSVYNRPRPDLFPHSIDVHSSSFPSGHSMMAAATFLTLGVLLAGYQERKRFRIFVITMAVLLTLTVGFSRVYLGVHWPTDVVAGWTIGAAWALACWSLLQFLQRRSAVETVAEE